MGQHTNEHNLLLDKLSQCEANSDVVYREFHNGDVKINDMVMNNRDDIRDAKAMIASHIRSTSGDDTKIANYDKYHKWIILLAGAFVTSMGRHIYEILMI